MLGPGLGLLTEALLAAGASVTAVELDAGLVAFLRERLGEALDRAADLGPGAPGGLRLEGWTAIDAQNKKTTVRLSNQRYNVAVPDSAFTFAEPKRKKA